MNQNRLNSKVKFEGWNHESVQWYLESEKHTEFYKKVIEEIMPFIKCSKTVLDIGCGTGNFSVEFAKKKLEVTAIDKSNLVIDVLKDKINSMKSVNINPINISYEGFSSNKYDIVFVSYMMGLIDKKNILNILNKVNKHLILVLPLNKIKNDFSIDELYRELEIDIKNLEQVNYFDAENLLKQMNKKYIVKKAKAEFGQIFNTIDEAAKFVYYYFNLPTKSSQIVASWLESRLINLNGKLYLPSIRESAIIII